jgi:GxxExxY protein
MLREEYERLGQEIFSSCLEVHRILGPGLLESVYESALKKELSLRKIQAANQVEVPLMYKGQYTGKSFYLDLLVEKEIIIELKAAEQLMPVHHSQLLSYLRLMDKRLGFLVNFNVPLIKDGFKRKVNKYDPEDQ